MFTIQYAKDLIWCNAEQTMFECIVKYAEFAEEMPSGVTPLDACLHIQELWARGLAGEYGPIAEYVPPPPPPTPNPEAAPDQPQTEGAQTL